MLERQSRDGNLGVRWEDSEFVVSLTEPPIDSEIGLMVSSRNGSPTNCMRESLQVRELCDVVPPLVGEQPVVSGKPIGNDSAPAPAAGTPSSTLGFPYMALVNYPHSSP